MEKLLEELGSTLIECGACLITVLNRSQEIVWFNGAMAKEFGDLSDLKGRKCYEAFAGSKAPHAGCAVQTALRTGQVERAVERLGGKPHLILAIPIDDDRVAEVIIEIPEREHSL
ncbi:PAS domain-containing protein [bacterium]|nr:PAS domain-containing protein [bacterium]